MPIFGDPVAWGWSVRGTPCVLIGETGMTNAIRFPPGRVTPIRSFSRDHGLIYRGPASA